MRLGQRIRHFAMQQQRAFQMCQGLRGLPRIAQDHTEPVMRGAFGLSIAVFFGESDDRFEKAGHGVGLPCQPQRVRARKVPRDQQGVGMRVERRQRCQTEW